MNEQQALRLFEEKFTQNMKGGNIRSFKKDLRTLYNKVIVPTILEVNVNSQKLSAALINHVRYMKTLRENLDYPGAEAVVKTLDCSIKNAEAIILELTYQKIEGQ